MSCSHFGAATLILWVLGEISCYAQTYGAIPVFSVKTIRLQPIDLTLDQELLFDLSSQSTVYDAQPVRVWVFNGSKKTLKEQKSSARKDDGCVRYPYWGWIDGTINAHLSLGKQRVTRSWFQEQNGTYHDDTWVLVPVAGRFQPNGVFWLHKDFVDEFFKAGVEIHTIPPDDIGTREDYERKLYGHPFTLKVVQAEARLNPTAPVIIPPAVLRLCVNREERAEVVPGVLLAVAVACNTR